MVNIDSLIFDLDGTLIDSKNDIVESVNFTLKQLGLSRKNPEEIISFIGTGVEDLIEKSIGPGSHLLGRAILIFEDFFKENSLAKTKLYPGAKKILEYFKRKRIYVATNRKKDVALAALENCGISKYFSDVVGSDDSSCVKPSGCPLNKILKSNSDKKKSMIIGDMDLDVLSGKEAGILTCAAAYGIGKKEDILKAKPDYIIENLLELKDIVN